MIDAEDPQDSRSYANVRLIQRVLAVLQAVNTMPVITIKGISEACAIPASTAVRIVETLCAEGYLIHLSRRAGYLLAPKIRSLSAGYHGAPLVVEMLKDCTDDLTRTHLWPFAVATLERDAMVVQYSSLPLSPLAHVRTTLHKRLSLLSRAHGVAYLSFCSSVERHRLLRLAVALNNPEDEVIRDAKIWRRLIRQTRVRGYALRPSTADPSTRSLAVPILLEPGRVVATLGVTFFTRSVNAARMAELAAALRTTAETAAFNLAAALAAYRPAPPASAPGRPMRRQGTRITQRQGRIAQQRREPVP